MRSKNYIPVIQENYDMFARFNVPYLSPSRKVLISKIKIDKSLMSFPNEVSEDVVETIIEYFDEWAWLPILIDKNNFLLDGQHRLRVAAKLKLRFIDAIVQDTELLEVVEKKYAEVRSTRKNKKLDWL